MHPLSRFLFSLLFVNVGISPPVLAKLLRREDPEDQSDDAAYEDDEEDEEKQYDHDQQGVKNEETVSLKPVDGQTVLTESHGSKPEGHREDNEIKVKEGQQGVSVSKSPTATSVTEISHPPAEEHVSKTSATLPAKHDVHNHKSPPHVSEFASKKSPTEKPSKTSAKESSEKHSTEKPSKKASKKTSEKSSSASSSSSSSSTSFLEEEGYKRKRVQPMRMNFGGPVDVEEVYKKTDAEKLNW